MTREELINVIYKSAEESTCPTHNCNECWGEDTCLKCAEKLLAEYEKQVVSNFAYWLTQKIDLRFYNNSSVWVDEYFNHTIEKLVEQLKRG